MDELYAMDFCADLESIGGLFGVPPKLEYPLQPYELNVITVEAELEYGTVWLNYMPSQGWAELRVVAKPFSVVKLLLSDISHLSVRKTKEDHFLLLRFARAKTSNLKLYLRPHVLLFWGNCTPDEEDSAEFLQGATPPNADA
jgi:hypothetical protein